MNTTLSTIKKAKYKTTFSIPGSTNTFTISDPWYIKLIRDLEILANLYLASPIQDTQTRTVKQKIPCQKNGKCNVAAYKDYFLKNPKAGPTADEKTRYHNEINKGKARGVPAERPLNGKMTEKSAELWAKYQCSIWESRGDGKTLKNNDRPEALARGPDGKPGEDICTGEIKYEGVPYQTAYKEIVGQFTSIIEDKKCPEDFGFFFKYVNWFESTEPGKNGEYGGRIKNVYAAIREWVIYNILTNEMELVKTFGPSLQTPNSIWTIPISIQKESIARKANAEIKINEMMDTPRFRAYYGEAGTKREAKWIDNLDAVEEPGFTWAVGTYGRDGAVTREAARANEGETLRETTGKAKIIDPGLEHAMMCARLEAIDRYLLPWRQGGLSYFTRIEDMNEWKQMADVHQFQKVWKKWLMAVQTTPDHPPTKWFGGFDPAKKVTAMYPNMEWDWHGMWIPCDVMEGDTYLNLKCVAAPKWDDPKDLKHIMFTFPRQFYAPMDQKGETQEVGSAQDFLIDQGKSVALQTSPQGFQEQGVSKELNGKKIGQQTGGGSRGDREIKIAGTEGARVKVEGTNVNMFDGKVYLDKWCINQMKCKKKGSTSVLVKLTIPVVPNVYVCGKMGMIWNSALTYAGQAMTYFKTLPNSGVMGVSALLEGFLVLLLQEMIVEGDGKVLMTYCLSRHSNKTTSMWDVGEVVTMDAKMRGRSCDTLDKGTVWKARKMRATLYSLLPLFSLKTWLFSPGGAPLKKWLLGTRQFILEPPTVSNKVLVKKLQQIVDGFIMIRTPGMRIAESTVKNAAYVKIMSFLQYWEFLMDSIEDDVDWDPCDPNWPMPLHRIGILSFSLTTKRLKPKGEIPDYLTDPPTTELLPFSYKYDYPDKHHKSGLTGKVWRTDPLLTPVDAGPQPPTLSPVTKYLICQPFKKLVKLNPTGLSAMSMMEIASTEDAGPDDSTIDVK